MIVDKSSCRDFLSELDAVDGVDLRGPDLATTLPDFLSGGDQDWDGKTGSKKNGLGDLVPGGKAFGDFLREGFKIFIVLIQKLFNFFGVTEGVGFGGNFLADLSDVNPGVRG